MERLWREFTGEKPPVHHDILKAVRYYYTIFQPYKDCDFDFIAFARALGNVSQTLGKADVDVERVRYNFVALEELYEELREHSHE